MAQEAGARAFITLIMPVYHAEKYLRAAIDSVLAQTFSDYELLLVDDCSPDGSGAICDGIRPKRSGENPRAPSGKKRRSEQRQKHGAAACARHLCLLYGFG